MKSALKTSEIDTQPPTGHVITLHPASDGEVRASWDGATQDEWGSICGNADFAPVYQSFAYGDALNQMGRDARQVRLFAGDQLIGVALVEFRKFMGAFTVAHIMRGPVWRNKTNAQTKIAAIDVLQKSLPARGAFTLVIVPDGHDDLDLKGHGYKCVMTGYHTALLDISDDESEISARLHGKWRNRLRAAEKSDLRISPISKKPEKYSWLLEQESSRQQKVGYRTHANALAPFYQSIAGKRSLVAFEAKNGIDRVGGALFLIHGTNATYHIGWTSEDGKSLNANNLLLWQAIKALKKEGVKTLDLDGLNTDYNPGIARFKIGTGAKVISMSGAWTKGPRWR